MEAAAQYVEQRNGRYYVAGTRVSLDSVVHAYRNGAAPESLLRSFSSIGTLVLRRERGLTSRARSKRFHQARLIQLC
jgi:hypothetical protein